MASRRRSSLPPFATKQGAYGTLYRFRVTYYDPYDPVFPDSTWSTWAYDYDHAEEKFYQSGEDEGWRIRSVEKTREKR